MDSPRELLAYCCFLPAIQTPQSTACCRQTLIAGVCLLSDCSCGISEKFYRSSSFSSDAACSRSSKLKISSASIAALKSRFRLVRYSSDGQTCGCSAIRCLHVAHTFLTFSPSVGPASGIPIYRFFPPTWICQGVTRRLRAFGLAL